METLFAKSGPEWTTLLDHTKHVVLSTQCFANYLDLDGTTATNGAILHDLGKAHPFFQKRLKKTANKRKIFRHEISSLFFLSIFPKDQWDAIIEMVVGHHKSVKRDRAELGLLDLEENDDYLDFHLGNWNEWSKSITSILDYFKIEVNLPSKDEALDNIEYCLDYCEKKVRERGYSQWRGLLMGADHFASAQIEKTEKHLKYLFKQPDLSFYNRQHSLYPLSLKKAKSPEKHSLVVAPTGAGKTDFLLRRCQGRVFYTLPFQASINAMFKRVAQDLQKSNPDLDIRVLHSASTIIKRKSDEDTSLQGLIGAALTVLTPHQLAAIAFGQKGFESVLLDVKGCDIILDEVHTYSGISQALVIKLIEILKANNCRIHIGTATMPSVLYQKILSVLGNDVLETHLPNEELEKFNRHTVHQLDTLDDIWKIIQLAVDKNEKILIVVNRVKTAQHIFEHVQEEFSEVASLLLHSRFKRGDRNAKEKQLLGLDEAGKSLGKFNTSNEACIVVSTQVVEVSLDISFDVMVTEAAPLDALIQRFGRINRKRSSETVGHYKPVYVIAPAESQKEVRPYDLEVVKRSFDVLRSQSLLKETEIQEKIDTVFPELNLLSIEEHSIFKSDGRITIDKLTHSGESILMKLLQIDSVSCITESDLESYENGFYEQRLMLEIPTYYYAVSKMNQSEKGNKPFIIPDVAYSETYGLDASKIATKNLNVTNQFL